MRKLTKKKQSIMLMAVLSCSAAMAGAMAWNEQSVSAETAIDTQRFALVDGASVRLKENDNGIRFQVEMGEDVYDKATRLDGDVVASKVGDKECDYDASRFCRSRQASDHQKDRGEFRREETPGGYGFHGRRRGQRGKCHWGEPDS